MPRLKRVRPAGVVFHVLNRAVARLTIFENTDDYDAFLRVPEETWEIVPLPIFAMAAMPNHWHFIVRPTTDDQVGEFFRRLTVTHTMRYHAHYQTSGTGHLYQGSVQVVPDSTQRAPAVRHAVHRTESRAGELRGLGGRLAVGLGLRSSAVRRKASLAGDSDQSTAPAPMAFLGEQGGGGRRSQSLATLHRPRSPLWQRPLDQKQHGPTQPRKHHSTAWTPAKRDLLTPFGSSA